MKYDKIATWWHEYHQHSDYGMQQFQRGIQLCKGGKSALDVGCGCGGRLVRLLQENGFTVQGIDVSRTMINLARSLHPDCEFVQADIVTVELPGTYDLIIAWDSIFHLPLAQHVPVLQKLCRHLHPEGLLVYTFGDAEGEHTDIWQNEQFYYSSIGINGNIRVLLDCGLKIVHLELDQLPHNHVTIMARKTC
jgi:trans-aconitate methyltransferase